MSYALLAFFIYSLLLLVHAELDDLQHAQRRAQWALDDAESGVARHKED